VFRRYIYEGEVKCFGGIDISCSTRDTHLKIKQYEHHQGVTNSTSFIYGNKNGQYLIGQYYNVTVYNINKNIDIKRSAHDTFLE
jgi:hypothetical protein